MNAQQEAVALWKFLESRGFEPSVRQVGRTLRELGLKFREDSLRGWLKPFRDASRTRPDISRDAQNEHAGRIDSNNGTHPGRAFTRAVKVSLISKSSTEGKPSDTKTRRSPKVPKQPGLDLGAASVPEIDFDVKRLDFPSGLPEYLPDSLDELKDVAKVFCQAFSYLKAPAKIEKGLRHYADALASMKRFRSVETRVAWQAFRDAVIIQGGKPLFPPQAKAAFNYLPGRAQPKPGPRLDSCGHPLPEGVFMPPIAANETAHYDGDGDWIIGNTFDPKPARRA